jgi:hypothetical protein
MVSASIVVAEDFKTINGKIYKDATISRVEPDGIVLGTKTGISKVYFVELPKDVQERFQPSPAKTVAAQRERESIKLEGKRDGPRQADKGWAAAWAHPAVSLRIAVFGTIILTAVLLAIIRSRY